MEHNIPKEVLVRHDEGGQTLPTQIFKSFSCFGDDGLEFLTAQIAIFNHDDYHQMMNSLTIQTASSQNDRRSRCIVFTCRFTGTADVN